MKYFLQFKSIQHFNFYNFLSLISTFNSCFVSISMLCFFECDVLLKGSIFKQPIGAFREYIAGVLSGPKYRLTTLISAVWSMFWRFYQRRKLCGSTWGGKSHIFIWLYHLWLWYLRVLSWFISLSPLFAFLKLDWMVAY